MSHFTTPLRHSPHGKGGGSATSSPMAPPPPQDSNVQVAVRCRPLTDREKAANRGAVVQCMPNSNEVTVLKRKTYAFDKVYGQYSTQKDVFRTTIKPVVDEALEGYNCTVFAYGQTGTGKTYTMQGDLSPDDELAGIIPRSVRYIFDTLQTMQQEYSIKISFLQIYNEELKDLLAPNENKKLRLMEDVKRGGIYCQNLLEVTTPTAEHVFELLETGVKNRITSETLMNENSSRSHSIFTIRIHCKDTTAEAAGDDLLRIGQLNLVDLAGSECIGRSGARNVRAREAGSINQSLLTLGRVITALVDNHPHIPYRDSKLTRLLQESLGGRAKTTIIATLAPCASSIDETLSTLEYAYRAKSIKNKPQVNQKMARTGLLKEYGNEIESLRTALQFARQKEGIFLPPAQFAEMEERISSQSIQISELEDGLEARNKACKELEETVKHQTEEKLVLQGEKKELEGKLARTESALSTTTKELENTSAKLAITEKKLRAFEANEKVLLERGATAAKLFRESEERSVQLFGKIGRKQTVENTNGELADAFSDESKSRVANFQARLSEHRIEQEGMFSDIVKVVNELESSHSRDLKNVDKNVNALVKLLDEWKAEMDVQESKEKEARDKCASELADSESRRQEDMRLRLSTVVQLGRDHAAAAAKELTKSQARQAEFLDDLQKLTTTSRSELERFFNEQSDKLLELQASIDMSIDEQTNQLVSKNAELAAALKDSHDKQQVEFDRLKLQLSQFVDACAKTQTEKLNEQTALLDLHKRTQQKHLLHLHKSTEHEIRASVQLLGARNEKNRLDSDRLQQQIAERKRDEDASHARQNALITTQASQMTEWSADMSELEKSHSAVVAELVSRQSQQDALLRGDRIESFNGFVACHTEIGRGVASDCAAIGDNLQQNVASAKRKLDAVSAQSQRVIDESLTDGSERLEELEVFMKKRRVDIPTGSTPTKQTHEFPTFEGTKIGTEQLDDGHYVQRSTESVLSNPSDDLGRSVNSVSSSTTSSADAITEAVDSNSTDSTNQRHQGDGVVESVEQLAPVSSATPSECAQAPSSQGSSSSSSSRSTVGSRLARPQANRIGGVKPKVGGSSIARGARVGAGPAGKLATLAPPKRYRAKSPLGESTNIR